VNPAIFRPERKPSGSTKVAGPSRRASDSFSVSFLINGLQGGKFPLVSPDVPPFEANGLAPITVSVAGDSGSVVMRFCSRIIGLHSHKRGQLGSCFPLRFLALDPPTAAQSGSNPMMAPAHDDHDIRRFGEPDKFAVAFG